MDFAKNDGLIPTIVQDATRHDVLMLAYMNPAALEKTLATGYVTFYSRSRQKLWTKGETSGNRLKLIRLSKDCDADTLLAEVEMEGDQVACHEGTRTCFTRPCTKEDR